MEKTGGIAYECDVRAVTELMHFIFLEFKEKEEEEKKKAVAEQRQQITNVTLIFVALQTATNSQLANATRPIAFNMLAALSHAVFVCMFD